ncbi:site-specific integrase [Kineococcus sp. NUM-3379]
MAGRGRRGHGEGSIFQTADGRWRASVDLGWHDGKRKRKYALRRTRREAATWLQETLQAQRNGTLVRESVTVAAWFPTYLEKVAAPKVRASTLVNYERDFRRHIEPSLGRIKLDKLEPRHLADLYASKTAAGLSAASVRHIHATLRRSLNVAMKWGLVSRNVALLVDPPSRREFRVEPLTVEEARLVLAAARGERLEARWVAALTLGLRQGEALGLWWEDVDLDTATLRVRRQLARGRAGEKATFTSLKSARSSRTLSMPPYLVEALRRHREAQEVERAAALVWVDPQLVFTTPIGSALDASNDAKAFKALLRAAGVRPVRLHDLRHTAASLLLAQGMHPRVVMEVLGHSQIGLTMNTYSHVMPSMLGEAAASMQSALWGEKP